MHKTCIAPDRGRILDTYMSREGVFWEEEYFV